ncbi:MAG: Nramp family divalent metal transporter [Candidatus Berkelbacteria bacterium]|nr:Nramp family divalent metal transporter [Candidatus Berkelbacteria bacterium]
MSRLGSFWRKIGPGLVTGASDDDPAGIVIYSQTGAQSGFGLLWSALFTFPLMAVVQEMCARIGLVTGHGLAGNLRRYYPRWILVSLVSLAVAGITLNIGSDLAAMADVTHLFVPIPEPILAILYAILIVLLLIFTSYRTLASFLKWIALTVLAYMFVPYFTQTNWREAIFHTVVPSMSLNRETVLLIVAILGTTISPYLFFWQTSMEVEDKQTKLKRFMARWIVTKHELRDMKEDVTIGMFVSNAVMWFIIVAAAVTLNANGITQINTAKEAAEALKPFVGSYAYIVFSLGIVSMGILAIPVLAGSSSYALAEVMGWQEGLNKKFHQAKQFYGVIIVSTLVGLLIPLFGIDPIKALFYTGVFYGITAPLLIFAILQIVNNKKLMGSHTNSPISNFLGYLVMFLMAAAVIGAFVL